MLAGALDLDLMDADDVLAPLSPDVLATHLPANLVSKVLEAALSQGAMTADVILQTIGPVVLCRHVPLELIWCSAQDAAKRAGALDEDGDVLSQHSASALRAWLRVTLEQALELGIVDADGIGRFVGPDALARCLPRQDLASLIASALECASFDNEMILGHVGVERLCEHASVSRLWRCICDTAQAMVGASSGLDDQVDAQITIAPPLAKGDDLVEIQSVW